MACLALFAVLLMLLAAAPGLIMLAVLMIPLGVPLSPWLGSLSASVQRAVPAAGSTEAFAWTFTVITAGMSAGSACGGMIHPGRGHAGRLPGGRRVRPRGRRVRRAPPPRRRHPQPGLKA
jgi:hypothetical protein